MLRHRCLPPLCSILCAAVLHGWVSLCVAQGASASAIPGATPGAAPAPSPRANQIALLLPLAAPDFAAAAEAVQAGCRAAVERNGGRPLIVVHRTDATPEQNTAAYESALERGSAVVVGPLTRSGVTALAVALAARGTERPRIPVLALNAPESGAPTPPEFHSFGMSLESEARLAARAAHADGRRRAVVVQSPGALTRRVSQAFAAEWISLGGRIADVQDVDPGPDSNADLSPLRERLVRLDADAAFLSAEARGARGIRPYLPAALPVYSVSLVNDGAARSPDLDGVQFFDMPWMLQPDHPAVMVYPRPERLPPGLQRFYALGIDACRIAAEMAGSVNPRRAFMIDGVTGQLMVRREGGAVEREPLPATFLEGRVAVVENAGISVTGSSASAAPATTAPPSRPAAVSGNAPGSAAPVATTPSPALQLQIRP